MKRDVLRGLAALALLFAASGFATLGTVASAQQNPHPTTPTTGPSSLPGGHGVVRGVVVDPENPTATGDLTVALYALQPDGTPGIGSTRTAPDGSFAFEAVSSDPTIVYLVGVRYAGVPYGERTGFVSGQTEIDLAIPVQQPTADSAGTRIQDSSIRVQALGSRLAIEEVHTVVNDGAAPILVPEAARGSARAPFEAALPTDAIDFQTGVFNDTGAFEERDGRILYWGPVYAGEQEIRFGYQVPVAPGSPSVQVEARFPRGTGQVRILIPPDGPEVASETLREATPREIDGVLHQLLEGDALTAGGSITLTISVPETTGDPDALRLGRAEVSVELDDTVLEVTQTQRIEVEPGAHVAGTPDNPLLRFELPLRAELSGLSVDAARLGVVSVDQGIEVIGPLGPGAHDFAFRYRLPANPDGTTLDLRFPATVPALQLRAADTGLVIESDRLHRLRPQAMGTRTWMLREAFEVRPDEIVSVRFVPLDARAPSSAAAALFVLGSGALVLLFVMAPLRTTRAARGREADDRHGPAHERDLVYATIRDLEHDFETGKVAESDYERTRQDLWARAVELMRVEQANAPATSPGTEAADAPALAAIPAPASSPEQTTEPVARFCPGCGGAVDPAWRFCSHCGGSLDSLPHSGEPAG